MKFTKYLFFICSVILLQSNLVEATRFGRFSQVMESLAETRFLHRTVALSFSRSLTARSSLLESKEEPHFKAPEFAIPTFDATFKHILSDPEVRLSFLKVFTKNPHIISSEQLNEHLSPLQNLSKLRSFVDGKDANNFLVRFQKHPKNFTVYEQREKKGEKSVDEAGTKFLSELIENFSEIKYLVPSRDRNSQLDFVCESLLDDNKTRERSLVEVQVVPQDYWDNRALAYAAYYYGRQLTRGSDWQDLKRVIAINILGGGPNEEQHWKKTPGEWYRHYVFKDLKHGHVINGIELYQYSIQSSGALKSSHHIEEREWIDFLRSANKKPGDVIKGIQTPAIQKAYELVRFKSLPPQIKIQYETEEFGFHRYSQHTQEKIEEGREEGKDINARNTARKMIKKKMDIDTIIEFTELTREKIEQLIEEEEKPKDK